MPLAPNMPRRTPTTSGVPVAVLRPDAGLGHRSSPLSSMVGVTAQRGLLGFADRFLAVDAQRHLLDLVVQLEDRVQQHLRTRRASGQVDVHRNDVVNALDDRVVVEHPARRRAHAHRQHPLRLGHLVVDLPQHRGHLLADPAGHDHQVGLPRRGREPLHAEPGDVEPRPRRRHHLDRAARQPERRRPQRALADVTRHLLDRRQQDAAGQLLL